MTAILAVTRDALRRRRGMVFLLLGVAVLNFGQADEAASIYRWVDEAGKVHYGDRPPGTSVFTPVEIEAAPERGPDDANRRAKARRLLDAIEAERVQERAASQRAKAEKARREQNCQAARRRLAFYQRANKLFHQGPRGERVYLSYAERAEALSKARGLVGHWCH